MFVGSRSAVSVGRPGCGQLGAIKGGRSAPLIASAPAMLMSLRTEGALASRVPIATDAERASEQIVGGDLRDDDDVVVGGAVDGQQGDGLVGRERAKELRIEELLPFE